MGAVEGLLPPSRSLLLETQSTTTLGKKVAKLFPGPKSSRNWIPSIFTLIPTIMYLRLIVLQVFRG